MNLRRFAHTLPLLAATALLVLPVVVQAAPPSGGGGSKVSVTAANPPDAFQGEELDVIVSGSGFDAGSTVSYLVTGTTDASQVEVLSVQFVSSTELKTRIRPKDAALPTEYDIQVQTSSGRKGKGTTLFRVKVAETVCTGGEPKEPEIAYVTALDTSGDIWTGDLYLSSASACDQYLLVEDAAQILPDTGTIPQEERFIVWVDFLRFAVRGNTGVVTWIDGSQGRSDLMALVFAFDSNGNVTAQSGGPLPIYSASDGLRLRHQDVRFADNGDIELVLLERSPDGTERRVSLYNMATGAQDTVVSGNCPVQDILGDCFEPALYVFWGALPDDIVVQVTNAFTTDDKTGVARLWRVGELWGQPELLLSASGFLKPFDVSPDGLMLHWFEEPVRNRGGKITGYNRTAGVLDLALCAPGSCSLLDRISVPAFDGFNYMSWTSQGSVLIFDGVNRGQEGFLGEYFYPFAARTGQVRIENVLSGLAYDAVE